MDGHIYSHTQMVALISFIPVCGLSVRYVSLAYGVDGLGVGLACGVEYLLGGCRVGLLDVVDEVLGLILGEVTAQHMTVTSHDRQTWTDGWICVGVGALQHRTDRICLGLSSAALLMPALCT